MSGARAPVPGRSDPVVMVTGAEGQVGWEVVRALAAPARVVPLRRADLDLTDESGLRDAVRSLRPTIIINAAAYTAVDRAEDDRATAFAVNAAAPRILAEEAARAGALLVHYSTDYVFDGAARTPYAEDDAPAPLGVYGESKLAGDRAIAAVGGAHLILRTSWVYSARGHNFLRTMLRLAREREELRVVEDQTGAPTPAPLIAATTADVLAQWMGDAPAIRDGPWGIYNVVTRGETSWYDFARRILALDPARAEHRALTVTPIATVDFATRAARPAYSVLDPSKLEQTFGIAIPHWSVALEGVIAAMGSE